jgi:glycerol-3-phosphate acyltransferase PlsY
MCEYILITLLFIGSYILGAIPFAYIFTKIFSHKDIMGLGWKKSSASNVLYNVGKVPAMLTFIFDVLKGFAVVYIANLLGFDFVIQAIVGLLAVIGHNYSIFLGFRGGRGLATVIGVALAFNPIMLLVGLIPLIILTLIWTAAIGTIIAYFFIIGWAYVDNEYGLLLFMVLALIPIIIKRISPFNTLKGNLRNRLLFDQDGVPKLRIKK